MKDIDTKDEWQGKATSVCAVIGRRIQSDLVGQPDAIKQLYMATFLKEFAAWVDPTWPFNPDWRLSMPERSAKACRSARP